MYDIIVKSMNGNEELLNKKNCSQITKLPQRNLDDVYILILHHYMKTQKGDKDSLSSGKEFPYSAKLLSKNGKGLIFKPSNLPESLQKIIVKYLDTIS